MKNLALIALVLALIGCTTTPPKVHTPVTNMDDIVLTEHSSEPLKLLASMQAVGVRDLTPKEFKRTARDRNKFTENVGAQDGFNRLAYEAGGVGLGLAAGLSVGSVLGFGALTSFTSDDTPSNYDFSWDFDGNARVYSQQGTVDAEQINKAIEAGFNDFIAAYPELFEHASDTVINTKPEGYAAVERSGRVFRTWVYNEKRKRRRIDVEPYYFHIGNSARLPKSRTLYMHVLSYCSGEENGCRISASVNNINKPMPLVTNLYRLIAANLPADHVIYLPPNQAVYRLPMITYGETGAIEFLTEIEAKN